ncbi:L-aspartate oxidase [Endomicrobium proavitum]|uniref:L-aspartate oxidase n=1 Tax=Endomicrobium proavitum TaxID=1408281 RepID=A0A0G3WJT3_9BACT|nr:L-aspartate oxidase [Endomicrobium proavitum]AKL98127.1 L-aspartate oxidase [Endomicrobium proavitum]
MIRSDYLIIGSGIAGLSLALKASQKGSVALITKRKLYDSATGKAQGGVACVTSKSDSFENHIKDTIVAGAGLCNVKAVTNMVTEGPARIKELIKLGVKFSKKDYSDSEFELGLEGGHSKRRILHAGDMTGNEIEKVLIENLKKQSNIQIYENHTAVDLIIDKKTGDCLGASVFINDKNETEIFQSKITVLASGGAGKTYLYTSNPGVATGDGVAMAYRAGAKISNMEFVQFHPTCLYNPDAKSFLISEAVRGEGGILRLKNGETFMEKYSSLKELAPRDIVARAIDSRLKARGENFVYLDITAKSRDFLVKRFPNIYAKCLEYGIDISKDMIPVVPAAHFFCGGVTVDENGKTTIPNLYAIGETACSGVHGANRLASNSLLEGIVYAHRAFEDSQKLLNKNYTELDVKLLNNSRGQKDSTAFLQDWNELRRLTWNYLGISRSNERLGKAIKRIEILKEEIDEYFQHSAITVDIIEVRNIVAVAEMIARSASLRKESRGLHYNTDYPFTAPEAKDTVITAQQQ